MSMPAAHDHSTSGGVAASGGYASSMDHQYGYTATPPRALPRPLSTSSAPYPSTHSGAPSPLHAGAHLPSTSHHLHGAHGHAHDTYSYGNTSNGMAPSLPPMPILTAAAPVRGYESTPPASPSLTTSRLPMPPVGGHHQHQQQQQPPLMDLNGPVAIASPPAVRRGLIHNGEPMPAPSPLFGTPASGATAAAATPSSYPPMPSVSHTATTVGAPLATSSYGSYGNNTGMSSSLYDNNNGVVSGIDPYASYGGPVMTASPGGYPPAPYHGSGIGVGGGMPPPSSASSSLPPPLPPVSTYWKQKAAADDGTTAVVAPSAAMSASMRSDYSDLDYSSMDFSYRKYEGQR
jgi:hypothetical protein